MVYIGILLILFHEIATFLDGYYYYLSAYSFYLDNKLILSK